MKRPLFLSVLLISILFWGTCFANELKVGKRFSVVGKAYTLRPIQEDGERSITYYALENAENDEGRCVDLTGMENSTEEFFKCYRDSLLDHNFIEITATVISVDYDHGNFEVEIDTSSICERVDWPRTAP